MLSDLAGATLPAAARTVPLLPGRAAARALPETIAALPATAPAVAAIRPDPPGPPAQPALSPLIELVEQVRQAYAEVLQYPVEVIGADAELEADLGVSSVIHAADQISVRLSIPWIRLHLMKGDFAFYRAQPGTALVLVARGQQLWANAYRDSDPPAPAPWPREVIDTCTRMGTDLSRALIQPT